LWDLNNKTPFAAERGWCRDRNGAEVWLVAGSEGDVQLADEQPNVCVAPEYYDDPETSSLRYDSDLILTKLGTDVIVNGSAYAPAGRPATQVDVSLAVGSRKKTLRVFGDRIWERSVFGPAIGKPRPFVKMPIVYERAFGGWDRNAPDGKPHDCEPRNPVGVGFATHPRHVIGMPLPNVEDPRSLIKRWKDRPAPAGFGPIPPHWLPRRNLGGTYDDKWERERLPLLPEDFDDAFYQCALEDQQLRGFLKGGETIELVNLTAQGQIRFRLPRLSLGFITYFGADDRAVHRAQIHTLILEPDVPRASIVWHTALPCHPKVNKLMQTTVFLKNRLEEPGTTAAAPEPAYLPEP
jgi:hypothetical protein